MPSTVLNREAVDRRIERLRDRFGDVPIDEESEAVSEPRFEAVRADVEDGYVGGGYAWVVRDPEDAPPLSDSMPDDATEDEPVGLLILHRGTGDAEWTIPGGTVEEGETYEEAAEREVREETGVVTSVTDCRGLRRRVVTSPEGDREAHFLYAFFEGSYEGGTLDPQASELRGIGWFARPPERVSPETEALFAEL